MSHPVIDFHSHYIPPSIGRHAMFFKAGWSDAERQISVMDQCGIDQALLLYPTSDAHLNLNGWEEVCRIYNKDLSDIVGKYPGRFIGAGIVPPDSPAAIRSAIATFDDLNLQAVSVASSYDGIYLDDKRFFALYEFASQTGRPVHVHPQIISPIGEDRVKDPLLTPVLEYVLDVSMCAGKLMMSGVLTRFPDVKFVFAHFGGVLPLVRERFDNTYQMLRKRDFVKDLGQLPGEYFRNFYFDVSGSKSPAALAAALEMVPVGQILFGSDFPANQDTLASVEAIRNSAALTPDQKAQILGGNAAEILGLAART